jgi:dTDP-glucose 4,6-dehydratase
LLGLLGKPTSLIKWVADRLGHDRRYAIDCSKAKRELGWTPKVAFDDGLRSTIAWYQANSDWVASIKNKDYLTYHARQYGDKA